MSSVNARPARTLVRPLAHLTAVVGALAAIVGCDVEPPIGGPSIPIVEDLPALVNTRSVTLRGTKESATALLVDGDEVVPLNEDVSFSVQVSLREGSNRLLVSVVDARGVHSGARPVGIDVDTTPPEAPTLEALLPRTVRATVPLIGTKPAGARLFFEGVEQTAAQTGTAFSVDAPLSVGVQTLSISTMDALENESAVVEATIERFAALPFAVTAPADSSVLPDASVLVTGTRGPGVTVEVNGVAVAADAVGGAWSSPLALTLGDNAITVRAHFEGEPTEAVEQTLNVRYAPIPDPPVLDPAPARAGATVQITGTKPANTALERDGVQVLALGPETTFVDDAPLAAEGVNTLTYETVSSEGQRSSPVTVDVIRDTTAPTLTLDPSLDGTIAGDLVDVSGTAADADPALVVEVCVGACALDADFTAVPVTAGAYDTVVDLAARADLTDGAIATVHVRATDSLSLRTEVSADLVLSRAAVPTGVAAGTTLAIAAGPAPFAVALAQLSGGEVMFAQDAALPAGGYASETLSDPAALAVGAPRIAGDGASGWVVFAEASARTSSADTTRGALAVPYDATGALAPVVVSAAAVGDVTALDVAALPSGEAAVALVVNDEVHVSTSTLGVFGALELVSDGVAAGITDVRVVADTAGALTVAWIETTARDGVLDDTDIVARGFTPGVGAAATIVTVTADAPPFADAGDETLTLAPLAQAAPADVAVLGTVNGQEAWLFVLGGAQLDVTGRARIEPAGDALALVLGADPGGVVAAVLDGGALLGGAPAPGVVALRGSPTALGAAEVLSTEASTLPAAAAGHAAFVDSRGVIIRALPETP